MRGERLRGGSRLPETKNRSMPPTPSPTLHFPASLLRWPLACHKVSTWSRGGPMDDGRFDAWTKTLTAEASSRRTALWSLLGAACASLFAPSRVRGRRAGCAAGGESCDFGGLCCSGVCATDGTCCHGSSPFGARCRRDRQCCSGRCAGRRCRCRRDQRRCRGVCLGPGQCCSGAECGEGETCNDYDHDCCPNERVAIVHPNLVRGDETCDCCCTDEECRCPCGNLCRRARSECLMNCCCDEDECECPPAGAAFPYTFCCGEGSLGDAGGTPGCCTTPPNLVTCPVIGRVR